MHITYAIEPTLSVEEFIDVLNRSGLGARRPVGDAERVGRMLRHANLIVCARADGLLIGVARALTDFSYCCYLSDLAVDAAHQRRGVGKELIRRVQSASGEESMLLLLAAPAAAEYYPHIGFQAVENGWIAPRRR
jgi:N-acetylglutamate synthase-like GNAT family acetyltransferase